MRNGRCSRDLHRPAALQPAGGTGSLTLQSWDRDTGKSHDPVTLVKGKDLHVISSAGEFLFIQDIGGRVPVKQRPLWVFSLDSGKEITKLTYAQAMAPLCVADDRLLRMTGGARLGILKSVDLRTGKSVWVRTFYRYFFSGQLPPSAPGGGPAPGLPPRAENGPRPSVGPPPERP